jgi:hypothetical protein
MHLSCLLSSSLTPYAPLQASRPKLDRLSFGSGMAVAMIVAIRAAELFTDSTLINDDSEFDEKCTMHLNHANNAYLDQVSCIKWCGKQAEPPTDRSSPTGIPHIPTHPKRNAQTIPVPVSRL